MGSELHPHYCPDVPQGPLYLKGVPGDGFPQHYLVSPAKGNAGAPGRWNSVPLSSHGQSECRDPLFKEQSSLQLSPPFQRADVSCSCFQSDQESRACNPASDPNKQAWRPGFPLPKGRSGKLSYKTHRQTLPLPASLDSLDCFWLIRGT